MNVKKHISKLDTPTIIKGGAILVGVIVLVKAYQHLFGKTDADKAQDQIVNLPYNRLAWNHTEQNLLLRMNNVFESMDRYGTDENTIINNLTGLNYDELLFIINEFGVREYNGTSHATGIWSGWMTTEKNLIGWLKAELGGSDLEIVAQIFNDAGIPF